MPSKLPITELDVEVAFANGFIAGMERIMAVRDPKHYPAMPTGEEARAAYMATFMKKRENL